MFDNKTLCLNMIVKNEAHIIEKTLTNLCQYFHFDYWVIADTGSHDGTQEVIQNFFMSKNIVGELVEHSWRDFAFNRNKSLDVAFDKTDYILFWDADEKMCGNFEIPLPFDSKMYYLKKDIGVSYSVPLLVSNRIHWKYVGVLHEYLMNLEPISLHEKCWVEGDYYIHHDANGASHFDNDKYENHGKILEAAMIDENDKELCARYAFYCAQSFKDAGNNEKAIQWYTHVAEGNINWSQERYYSYLQLGKLYYERNNILEAIKYMEYGIKIDEERPECISYLMEYYYSCKMHSSVMAWFLYFKEKNKNPMMRYMNHDNKLFLDSSRIYYVYYFVSISAYYDNDFLEGKKALTFLIENITSIPNFMHNIIIENKKFYDM